MVIIQDGEFFDFTVPRMNQVYMSVSKKLYTFVQGSTFYILQIDHENGLKYKDKYGKQDFIDHNNPVHKESLDTIIFYCCEVSMCLHLNRDKP